MAQISMATCSMPDRWGFNSVGQSPCEIGAELGGVCTGGSFILPALPPNSQYQGPNATVQNSCRCSSVYYSLLSACAYCQGRNYIRWSDYNAACDVVYEQKFPHNIPIGLVVPGWAYEDVKTRDTFNASVVTAIGFDGEVTGTLQGDSVPTSRSREGGTAPLNVPALAGGIAGGVVFLILLGILVACLIRRRRQKQKEAENVIENNLQYGVDTSSDVPNVPRTHRPSIGSTQYMSGSTIAPFITHGPPPRPLKLYNPDDPSTWPHNYDVGHLNTSLPTSRSDPNTSLPFSDTDHPDGLLPSYTGHSSSTAVTRARTTTDYDTRYQNVEI